MLESNEVNPITAQLQQHGIEVEALHSHMLDEEPRLFFMHYWALGDPAEVICLQRGTEVRARDEAAVRTGEGVEIGFGPGLAIEMAARLVGSGKVVGVDRSGIMLRQASRRNRAAIGAGRVQLHLASSDALPPFTEPFDKAMASNVHLFLDDPVSTLRGWLVITRPGGWVAITHQSRKQAAIDADTAQGANRIAADLRVAGFADCGSRHLR